MEVYKFHSDKELLLEMSASITLYSGQLTLINNSIVMSLTDSAPQFLWILNLFSQISVVAIAQ